MLSRRLKKKSRKNKNSRKNKISRKNKSSRHKKNWTSAVSAAQSVYTKTGSYDKARAKLRSQAYGNARRLFGSFGEQM